MRLTKILKFNLSLCAALALFLLAGCGSDSPPAGQTPSPTAAQPVPTKGFTLLTGEPQIIRTPDWLPTIVLPTPVPALEEITSLSMGSSPEAIRERVLLPQWDTLWLDGTATLYLPDGTVGNFHTQAWLDRHGGGQVLNSDQLVDTPTRAADLQPRWLSLSDGGPAVVHDLKENKIDYPHTSWLLHPHEMAGYVTERVFPRGIEWSGVPSSPVAEEMVAGRRAVVVDWNRSRMWIDAVTGVILKEQQFDWENRDILTQEIIINEIAYQIDLPLETKLTYISNQVFFDKGPAPAGFDPKGSNLVIKYVEHGEPEPGRSFASFAVDLYADGYYLGFVETGLDPLYNCERSPDGSKLTFVYTGTEDEESHLLGSSLHWFNLRDLGVVNDPLPGLHPAAPPIWSPDNRHIAFSACQTDGACGVYIFDTVGEEIVFKTHQGYSMWPVVWSPDGKFFLVVVNSLGGEGVEPIWVIELDTGELVYEGVFDANSWQFPSDAPIHEWGVDYPRGRNGFQRCEAPPKP